MAQITTQQLNEVARLLGTDDKNLVVSAVIATLVSEGVPVDAAYDMVWGEGAYAKLAGEVYDALHASGVSAA